MNINKGYIEIKEGELNPIYDMLLPQLGFKQHGNIWKAQDDYMRRVMIGGKFSIEEGIDISKEEIEKNYPYLRDFQVEDIQFMVKKGKMLNANTMGLGKTLETIVSMDILGTEKNLIICPKSVRSSWVNELKKWLGVDDSEICIIRGTPKQREKATSNLKKYNIINYELLRNEKNKDYKNLLKTDWDCIVCDEVHRIKNRKSKQSKGVKKLKSKYKFALTGTPVQNRPDDLYSILEWIDPKIVGRSYWRFVETFCEIEDNYFGKKPIGLTQNRYNQEVLKRLLGEFMVRRTDDSSLPRKNIFSSVLGLDKKQEKLYRDIQEEILIELENSEHVYINSALTRLVRLQQVTSNPQKFGLKENPKFEFIKDLIEDNPDKKIVVFSRFKETINSLEEELKVGTVKVTGDTEERGLALNRFADDDIRVFLGTIGAVGEGVNGLQEHSNIMVFIDREWSPAKNEQAIGRLVRQGQKERVLIYNLIMEGTIDEHVENILNKKTSDIIKILK